MYTLIGAFTSGRGLGIVQNRWGEILDSHVLPASAFCVEQISRIPLRANHDPDFEIGTVKYLEREAGVLKAVAQVTDEGIDYMRSYEGDWYLSANVDADRHGLDQFGTRAYAGALLEEISVVQNPVGIGLGPVRTTNLDIQSEDCSTASGLGLHNYDVLKRAHADLQVWRSRRRVVWTEIHDVDPEPARPPAFAATRSYAAPEGQVFRHSFPASGLRMTPEAS